MDRLDIWLVFLVRRHPNLHRESSTTLKIASINAISLLIHLTRLHRQDFFGHCMSPTLVPILDVGSLFD